MDCITNNFLNSFSREYGLLPQSIEAQFEHFANYCAIANETNNANINPLDIYTGDSCQSIDGVAIQVNGRVVTSINEINEVIAGVNSLTANFIFIRAKSSDGPSSPIITNAFSFVQAFFNNTKKAVNIEGMQHFLELKDYIYSKSNLMRQRKPNLQLYYVSCEVWNSNDQALQTAIQQNIDQLEQTNLFESVSFIPFGPREMQAAYRKSFNDYEATFIFDKRITLLSDDAGNIGYSGVLPYREFKRIICTQNGSLKDVFEDNIRIFLENDNEVNSSIDTTLQSGSFQRFSVLNNGITIVADSVHITGDRVTITNYQIVSGCQTSRILFARSDIPGMDSLLIPIRLIATNDEDFKSEITLATNNQTSIKKEQLEALFTFQRTLEEYYRSYTEPSEALYYERRVGQYRNKDVPKCQIVSTLKQIKATAAMFMDKPHDVSNRYGTIAKKVGTKLFRHDHKPILYYVSALALFRFESLIKQKKIELKYRKARYHAIMLFKYVVGGKNVPKYYNSRAMETYCERIRVVLNTPERCINVFAKILEYIVSRNDISVADRNVFERKETTDLLLRSIDDMIFYVNN